MYYKEFRATIEALEAIHAETCTGSNNPHDTARRFIRSVGPDTAAQCVAAMVRRLHWDGRISRTARAWAESVSLSTDWERRIDEAHTDRIHASHLSQIAEAMPSELEFVEAEQEEVQDAEPADLDIVEIPVLGRVFSFSSCRTGREWVFVHDTTDTGKTRDCLIFGVHLPKTTKEAVSILSECEDYYTAELARDKYLEQVEQADSLDQLDQITETAANDDTISTADYETIHAAALRKAQSWDPQNRERREHPAQEPQYTAETYKDNAGRLHLAVLDSAGACVYYLTDADSALVMDALAALIKGGDPVADAWEGGEPDPAAAYKEITQAVEARNGGAWEIDAVQAMGGGASE